MQLIVRATGIKFEVIDIKHAQIKLKDYIKEHGFGSRELGGAGVAILKNDSGLIIGYLSYNGTFQPAVF